MGAYQPRIPNQRRVRIRYGVGQDPSNSSYDARYTGAGQSRVSRLKWAAIGLLVGVLTVGSYAANEINNLYRELDKQGARIQIVANLYCNARADLNRIKELPPLDLGKCAANVEKIAK